MIMKYNQEILRKHTALTVSRKDVDTSLLLFPVRLETRFVEGKRVDDISEPHRVLYAYKAIWNYVRLIPSPSFLPAQARRVVDAVENLDTVYREDKTRLRNICEAVASRTAREGELKELWDRVLVHLDRLSTLDIVHDNEATEFLYKLEKVYRTMDRMRNNPRFSGASRFKKDSVHSQTAVFKNARKEMQACLEVLEQFLPDDPSKSIVNRFTLITPKQFRKFEEVIHLFDNTVAGFKMPLERIGVLVKDRKRALALREQIMRGFERDLAKYQKYRDRFFGSRGPRGEFIPGRYQSLRDKMRSKQGDYCHYTRFAERMIMWQLRLLTGSQKDIASSHVVSRWRKLAEKTIFHFHEEREWLVSVLEVYNDYQRERVPGFVISRAHLNRHNRYIRPRRLAYRIKTKKSLLVRIYPDEVAVTQLAKPLNSSEVEHGREFWLRIFAAGGDEMKHKAAWRSLCSFYTPPRAALIARGSYPENADRVYKLHALAKEYAQQIADGLSEESKERLFEYFGNNKGGPPSQEELFPTIVTEMMPDRFILQASMDNGDKKDITMVKYGRLIPKSLQVGLDFNRDDYVDGSDKQLRFTGNLRWMTDYDAAERMGMAITLPLDAYGAGRQFHFNSIYVMGLKEFDPDNTKDSAACSSLLAKVLDAHVYSDDGFDLLKIGTPTNILSDEDLAAEGTGSEAKSSEYDTGANAQVEEFYRNIIRPSTYESRVLKPFSDAARLSALFCFDSLPDRKNPFTETSGWDNMEIRKAELVREAFIRVLRNTHPILKVIFDTPRLRKYFVDCVSPVGVYPPFRIGSQPYGIVPVCDFKNLKYSSGDPLHTLTQLLLLLTEKWNAIAANSVISEENMNQDDKIGTEQRYVKAVSATPISTSFYARANVREQDILTPQYFKGLKDGVDPIGDVLRLIGSINPSALAVADPIGTYLPSYPDLPLRDSIFAEFKGDEKFTWGSLKDAIRKEVKNIEQEAKKWADEIDPHHPEGQEEDLSPFQVFEGVSDKEADDLITATFDLFNHRLDAWLTGLLQNRLVQRTDRMQKGNHKIALGAYGWVFNLSEEKASPVKKEYVVAPSINQAITAAVLRSSYNRAVDGDKKDYSMSVNLSSARVRQALRIISGIQNGLSLGAILGSDLERLLHDDKKRSGLEMDYFIYFLRAAYPLDDTSSTYGPGDKEHSIDVLNGVALLEDLRRRTSDIPGSGKLQLTELYVKYLDRFDQWMTEIFHAPSMDKVRSLIGTQYPKKIPRLFDLIQEMEDSFDALSDVVTAESVYKLTEGNTAAVDALMNSLQNGRSIPTPDVTEIPVHCAHIEQRVIAALMAEAQEYDRDSYLGMADPGVDQWIGDHLGFSRMCTDQGAPQWLDEEKGLGISPAELVYLSGDWEKFCNFVDWLVFTRSGKDVQGTAIPLEEAKFGVDAMRELLAHARELRQDDLASSGKTPDPAKVLMETCARRYASVVDKVHQLYQELSSVAGQIEIDFKAFPEMPLTEKRLRKVLDLLLKCFRLGLTDALNGFDRSLFVGEEFRYEHPTDFAAILARHKRLPKRLAELAGLVNERVMKAEGLVKTSVPEAMKALLGSYLIVAPPFELNENEAIDSETLREQYYGPYFRNVNRQTLEDTLMELAEVSKPLNALHQVRLFGKFHNVDEMKFTAHSILQLAPFQLGYKADQEPDRHYWMGAEVPQDGLVRDASVYTMLNAPEFFIEDGTFHTLCEVAGLVLDYWVEKIPYREQTAGVAFSYDQPDAEPPQAVLVGVSTIGARHKWSEHRMLRTIRSAMHQVKTRAVEPEHVYADKWTSALFPLVSLDPDNPVK